MNSIGNLFIDYVPVVLPVVSILRVPVQGATSMKPSVAGSNKDDAFDTGTHRVREPATVKPGVVKMHISHWFSYTDEGVYRAR